MVTSPGGRARLTTVQSLQRKPILQIQIPRTGMPAELPRHISNRCQSSHPGGLVGAPVDQSHKHSRIALGRTEQAVTTAASKKDGFLSRGLASVWFFRW